MPRVVIEWDSAGTPEQDAAIRDEIADAASPWIDGYEPKMFYSEEPPWVASREAIEQMLKDKEASKDRRYPYATIDHEVKATYVYLRHFDPDTEPRLRTRDLSKHLEGTGVMLHVDIDADGKAVGVEIL